MKRPSHNRLESIAFQPVNNRMHIAKGLMLCVSDMGSSTAW